MHWHHMVEMADLFKKTENTEHYLADKDEPKPWEHVTKIENGGTWRWDVPVSLLFIAEVDGLKFTWYEDIEVKNINELNFNAPLMQEIKQRLPRAVRPQLMTALEVVVQALEKVANEAENYASQRRKAATEARRSL